MRRLGLPVLALALAVASAQAADVPITGLKLIVVDKIAAAGKAKAVFVAKDAGVTKGSGTDPTQIEATLDILYGVATGAFAMPQGGNWVVNSATVAKYVNATAPTAGAVKVSVIKPGTLVKVVGKSLGDTPLDISGAALGPAYVAYTILNDGETRLCTQFSGCVHKTIAGGTGYKLLCKGNGAGDAACAATVPPPCVATSGTFCDLGDGTIYDAATGLQWEKKTTAVNSGVNAADLHDVDNTYRWAGFCSVTSKRCQPNAAAETACKAQTDAAHWGNGCEQCLGGEGVCTWPMPGITTVWDWLNQLNAASYAGHNDWRLPSESACNSCYSPVPMASCVSCSAHELETLLLEPHPCGTSPCIDPIFGPTHSAFTYWSASTSAPLPTAAWGVGFSNGLVDDYEKNTNYYLRAVRGGA